MTRDLFLAIDVGTGSCRAALVDAAGRIHAIAHHEHDQIVPRHGWSEQRPAAWWDGTVASLRAVLERVPDATRRVAAICACGQMHGAVLVDADGRLTRETAPLWNDKRSVDQVAAFAATGAAPEALALTANAPAPAWPAFKLAWLIAHDPGAVARAAHLLMPKDWINLNLTGQVAQDRTEASLSFLMDWRRRDWSDRMLELTGLPRRLLPDLRDPSEILGAVTPAAAAQTGLPKGLPVLVGGGDYPMALLGSGALAPGTGSDVTGTSTILTLIRDAPVMAGGVSNVLSAAGAWGSFTLLDAGGDAVRWARRAFHDNALSYAEVDAAAAQSVPGANTLFFLPYLAGERFGAQPNSRAQFFGLTAAHGLPDLHRAVLEGVAFSVRQELDRLQGGHGRPERIIAASGGAKSALWLSIKAAMYRTPYRVAEEPESGVIGAGILMAVATGAAPDLATATARMVRLGPEITPDPVAADRYDAMMPVFSDLYRAAQAFYDRLDRLSA
ncbi:MAG: xylulokinase [Rhodobacteraceae bacterium HLUCCA08]|nr:MAG: xylulokinase [Rhodobacteraceae bacterium HLUCCA08]